MKISKEVRDFAAENNLDGDKEAIEKGMEEMSQKFVDEGSEIYS